MDQKVKLLPADQTKDAIYLVVKGHSIAHTAMVIHKGVHYTFRCIDKREGYISVWEEYPGPKELDVRYETTGKGR